MIIINFIFIAAVGIIAIWLLIRVVRTRRFAVRDKVFLITGGSRGLGLVLAREVCNRGGKVVVLARNMEELTRAEEDLEDRGGEVLAIACDLQERAHIEAAVRRTIERFGRIDVLINNAGVIQVGPFDHMQREDFEQSLGLHFWAPYELVMQVVPHMKTQGGGRIVNISSIGGKMAVPHMSPYSAGKFALTGFSDSIRAELARDQIQVTTVAPGLMRTGSHVHAQFKGEHEAEFAWFASSSGLPLISMNAERAARKILGACRRGQASLTLTFAARLGIAGNAIAPNLTGSIMKAVNRFLPQPTASSGDELRAGWQSRSSHSPPRWLSGLADAEIGRNNETPSDQATQ
ncbi:MAG TPA: SDR family oxidoreductase [Chthoniobacterales bacterium]|jgi:NAD(P)-dependent dehydrogenase (short-subunit alcohol dehydrogenase family)